MVGGAAIMRSASSCGSMQAAPACADLPTAAPLPAGGMGASKQTVESLKSLPPQQQLMMVALGKLLGEAGRAYVLRIDVLPLP